MAAAAGVTVSGRFAWNSPFWGESSAHALVCLGDLLDTRAAAPVRSQDGWTAAARWEGCVAIGSERCARDTSRRYIRAGVMVLLAAIATAGAACTRASASSIEPAPTYIPQPTPDPTMAVVIQGGGSPVAYLPPLEMKGSPTPLPAARPGSATGARPAAKPRRRPRPPARLLRPVSPHRPPNQRHRLVSRRRPPNQPQPPRAPRRAVAARAAAAPEPQRAGSRPSSTRTRPCPAPPAPTRLPAANFCPESVLPPHALRRHESFIGRVDIHRLLRLMWKARGPNGHPEDVMCLRHTRANENALAGVRRRFHTMS